MIGPQSVDRIGITPPSRLATGSPRWLAAPTRPGRRPCPFEGSVTLAVVRKIRAADPDPEERLDELLAERGQEIAEQAERLEEAVRDLERREQLLRDSRASIERLLRLGTTDLESREAELVQLVQEVTAREDNVRLEEAEVARRREELGAVELKRAAVERRERAVEEREAELALAASGGETSTEPGPLLLFVPGPGNSAPTASGRSSIRRSVPVTSWRSTASATSSRESGLRRCPSTNGAAPTSCAVRAA